jgi:hypothetical protein
LVSSSGRAGSNAASKISVKTDKYAIERFNSESRTLTVKDNLTSSMAKWCW